MSGEVRMLSSLPQASLKKFAGLFDRLKSPNWRTLVSELPDSFFSAQNVEQFALAILKPNGSPTMALLKDLMKRNWRVSDLINCLNKLQQRGFEISQAVLLLEHDGNCNAVFSTHPSGSISVLTQPVSGVGFIGGNFNLQCSAYGDGQLKYQWFHGAEPVGSNSCILSFSPLEKCNAGLYVCRISNASSYCFTEWAAIDLQSPQHQEIATTSPLITVHPRAVSCLVGDEVRLFCDAVGNPAPTFQWYHDERKIPEAQSREFIIDKAHVPDAGLYVCVASNYCGTKSSLSAAVNVAERTKHPLTEPDLVRGARSSLSHSDQELAPVHGPTSKVALLIGNVNYVHKDELGLLVHPGNDARDIGGALRSIGFTVVSLLDLNLRDFKRAVDVFCELLTENVYAVFYFAGHGFEVQGHSYLMPVDATDSFHIAENYPASEILQRMVKRNSKLNFVILDCCRTTPESYINNPIPSLCENLAVSQSNVVVCFGCCSQGRVFESPMQSNGFFAKHLCEHIGKKIKVDDVIFEVAKSIYNENIIDPVNRRAQVIYRYSTLVDELSLCDEISSSALSADNGYLARIEAWKLLHEVPKSPVTVFQNNCVRLDFIFMAEFSNVLLIKSKIYSAATCVVRFLMPSSIGGSKVEILNPGKGEKDAQFCNGEVVRISNLENLQGDVTIHLEVTYDLGNERKRQMAFYSLVKKPLYARITDWIHG